MRIVLLVCLLIIQSSCAHLSPLTCQEECALQNQKCSLTAEGKSTLPWGTKTAYACSNGTSSEEATHIVEDAASASERVGFNAAQTRKNYGVGLFSAGYLTALSVGGNARSYMVSAPGGFINNEPGKLYLIPFIGPWLQWTGQSNSYVSASIAAGLLQAGGLGIWLSGLGYQEPKRAAVRIFPTQNGAATQVDIHF